MLFIHTKDSSDGMNSYSFLGMVQSQLPFTWDHFIYINCGLSIVQFVLNNHLFHLMKSELKIIIFSGILESHNAHIDYLYVSP